MSLRKDFVADECRCGREIALRVTTGCGGDRYHSGGFLPRIMPPSWHPVPASNPSHPRFWRFSWIKLTSIPPSPLHVKGSFSRRLLQAGHSSLLQRRIELDAEVLCRYDRSRRNHSLLSQRKLVSDADVVVATPAAGGTILCCSED